MSLPPGQQTLLRTSLSAGLERSRELLAETAAAATRVRLEDLTICPLADFDAARLDYAPSGDLIAGVMQRIGGRLDGTALLAMEPGDALLWLQRGDDDGDPLGRFVDWGNRLIAGVVDSLAAALQAEASLQEPTLEERPLMAALLGTHAPSDTMVLSLQGDLAFPVSDIPEIQAPFSIHVLLAPKLVAGIVAGPNEPGDDEDRASA